MSIEPPLCHCSKPYCSSKHSVYAPVPEETKLWGRNKRTGLWDMLRVCYVDDAPKWLEIFSKDPAESLTHKDFKLSKRRPKY